jgi:AraC family transcriptional regulator
VPISKKKHQTQFHRSQIGRAQRFIRLHVSEPITLTQIAREAGSSEYHFARLFLAYTSETPFDFLRRIRLITALRMLQEDPGGSITEIALNVGYETPSAFNKVFKRTLDISPRDFRNLGKDGQADVIYRLSRPRLEKEIAVNLTPNFDIVQRPTTPYVFLEKHGPFAEIAPPTWDEMFPLLYSQVDEQQIVSFMGLSTIDKTKSGEEAMIYEAGVGLNSAPEKPLKGLQYKNIKEGNYARFLLTGPYAQIWIAFNQIFKTLAENGVELRPGFCIENYLSDPKAIPQSELKTEILVPVA